MARQRQPKKPRIIMTLVEREKTGATWQQTAFATVFGLDGSPEEGVQVSFALDEGEFGDSKDTDVNGQAHTTFKGITPGKRKFKVKINNTDVQTEKAKVFEASSGGGKASLRCTPGGGRGSYTETFLLRDGNNEPVADATITIHDPLDAAFSDTVTTDSGGMAIWNVPAFTGRRKNYRAVVETPAITQVFAAFQAAWREGATNVQQT